MGSWFTIRELGQPDVYMGLDPTGETLPDTSYEIPGGAIFMSPSGNDVNAGTEGSPVLTINRAVTLVANGGTVVMRGGTYRDWYKTPSGTGPQPVNTKSITIQAYPHEEPWFDGSDVVSSGWTNDGSGHWWHTWETPIFCGNAYYENAPDNQQSAGPCTYPDNFYAPTVSGDPQMVFIDDVELPQVPTLAQVTANNFFYDWNARRIYIGVDPATVTVELAARPTAIVLGGNLGHSLRGIGFRRYASNTYDGNLTPAAVYISAGSNPFTVENCVFTHNAGYGLFTINGLSSVVRSNVFAFNGMDGYGNQGSITSGGTNDLLVENNVIHNNNTQTFGPNCTSSCTAAGMKFANQNGCIVRFNVFEGCGGKGPGVWFDRRNTNIKIVYNLVRNNGGHGIYHEVGSTCIIASNLVYGNGGFVGSHGIGIVVASGNTKVYNNTCVDNLYGIWVYDDPRLPNEGGNANTNTVNVELVNNVVADNERRLMEASDPFSGGPAFTGNTRPSQYFTDWDHNAYWRKDGSNQVLYQWAEGSIVSYFSAAAFFAAKGWDNNAVDETGGSDPFFVNAAAADYRVRPGSPAIGAGTTMPADVAAALGITPTTDVVGAINWPGKA